MRRYTAAQGSAWTIFWDQKGWFSTYGCALEPQKEVKQLQAMGWDVEACSMVYELEFCLGTRMGWEGGAAKALAEALYMNRKQQAR